MKHPFKLGLITFYAQGNENMHFANLFKDEKHHKQFNCQQ